MTANKIAVIYKQNGQKAVTLYIQCDIIYYDIQSIYKL